MVTSTDTVAAEESSVLTVNDAECAPAGNPDAKLTVTLSSCTPLVGETTSQDAVGGSIHHFIARLPSLLMSSVCDGGVVPSLAWTLIVAGVMVSTAWADADRGTIRAATKAITIRPVLKRIFIGPRLDIASIRQANCPDALGVPSPAHPIPLAPRIGHNTTPTGGDQPETRELSRKANLESGAWDFRSLCNGGTKSQANKYH